MKVLSNLILEEKRDWVKVQIHLDKAIISPAISKIFSRLSSYSEGSTSGLNLSALYANSRFSTSSATLMQYASCAFNGLPLSKYTRTRALT